MVWFQAHVLKLNNKTDVTCSTTSGVTSAAVTSTQVNSHHSPVSSPVTSPVRSPGDSSVTSPGTSPASTGVNVTSNSTLTLMDNPSTAKPLCTSSPKNDILPSSPLSTATLASSSGQSVTNYRGSSTCTPLAKMAGSSKLARKGCNKTCQQSGGKACNAITGCSLSPGCRVGANKSSTCTTCTACTSCTSRLSPCSGGRSPCTSNCTSAACTAIGCTTPGCTAKGCGTSSNKGCRDCASPRGCGMGDRGAPGHNDTSTPHMAKSPAYSPSAGCPPRHNADKPSPKASNTAYKPGKDTKPKKDTKKPKKTDGSVSPGIRNNKIEKMDANCPTLLSCPAGLVNVNNIKYHTENSKVNQVRIVFCFVMPCVLKCRLMPHIYAFCKNTQISAILLKHFPVFTCRALFTTGVGKLYFFKHRPRQ